MLKMMMFRCWLLLIFAISIQGEHAPPVFDFVPPMEQIKREGGVLLLRCQASGRPTPVITWLKNGYPILNGQDGVRISDSDGQLAISPLTKSHEGVYTCRAQNVVGSIDTSTTLHIEAPPTIIAGPQNTTVRNGDEVTFLCQAEGYPEDIRYKWFYHGVPIESAGRDLAFLRTTDTSSTLSLDAKIADAGIIGCSAENSVGESLIANARLTVTFPARVRKMPSIMHAGLGIAVDLPCPADAVPPVTIVTWHRDGTRLAIDKDERLSLGENGSLVINPVQTSDSSRYSCQPYNMLGTQGRSTEFTLVVMKAPVFTRKPDVSYYGEIAKRLTMRCNGTGDPPLHLSWAKIDESGKEIPVADDGGRITIEDGNLTIHRVLREDHGTWQCILRNPAMEVRANATLFVRYTAPHVVTDVRVETSKYNARISWKPGYDGGRAQHFIIWYRGVHEGTEWEWRTHRVPGYRNAATVGDLEPDMTWQFSIMSENSVGYGQFSKMLSARTKALTTKPKSVDLPTIEPPGQVEYFINRNRHLVLMWQPPLDAKQDELLGYIVESRMLLPNDEEKEAGEVTLIEENVDSFSPSDSQVISSAGDVSPLISGPDKERVKRDSKPSESDEAATDLQWTPWTDLMRVPANTTEIVVPGDKLYMDQFYEFHVVAVTMTDRSNPSAVIAISTKDLDVYPLFVPPSHVIAGAASTTSIIVPVIVAAVVLVMVCLAVWMWCARRRAEGIASEEKEKLNRRSRSTDSYAEEEEAVPSREKSGKSNGSIFNLKKKMLKADVQMGRAYSNTEEAAGLARKVSHSEKFESEVVADGQVSPTVRKINRAADGKFRVTGRESDLKSTATSPSRSFQSRPHSAEWDTREPLLQAQDDSLEIDCSRSDIEVRYIKDARGNGSCYSSSMTSLAGPKQYNLAQRQIRPCDKSLDSSYGDASFRSGDYRHTPHLRQNFTPAPYQQYVNMRGGDMHRKHRNPDYRISSPPRFPDYSMAPNSPSKYRHNQYRPARQDNHPSQPDGPVYDPRCIRIEPIYEVGPYQPYNPPNRHSSFVIDTRRELPDNPIPHRAIQICTTSVPNESQDRSSYPTPRWRDAQEQYHTLPQKNSSIARNDVANTEQDDVELSLRRHDANACLSRKTFHASANLGTNSLGRRRKNDETPKRRRVLSMDDVSIGNGSEMGSKLTPGKTGSVDLLMPRRKKSVSKEKQDIVSRRKQDRTAVGFEAEDEDSDAAAFSPTRKYDATNARLEDANRTRETGKFAVPPAREDDSSAVSSMVQPARVGEILSSGYDSHNTSRASSGSPALSLPHYAPPDATMQHSLHGHDRTSTASSSDRSRKETSSVDDKYEWDSEFDMQKDIVNALRHYGNHSRSGQMSQVLIDELRKLGVDKLKSMDGNELAAFCKEVESRGRISSSEESDRSTTVDTADDYSKESIQRRCEVLKREFRLFQLGQTRAFDAQSRVMTSPNV